MSYLPLARKYRPGKFKDLVGQEAVALALSNGIRIGREPAAVMFSGVRGIGKTTTARIYAKALNCSDPQDTEPCDQCESCESITNGSHEDVVEIDGASHNGVDEVRALRETVQYLPQRSPYKVYIIDEVHMLSVSAFNALLKTLEEPPEKVVFIFATTELQKVPQTIIGRCQTFWLKKMSLADTEKRLRYILDEEGLEPDAKVISLIARQGQGSMRDALTFLDQAIALGAGTLDYKLLAPMISGLSTEQLTDILTALVHRDAKGCIEAVHKLDQDGKDFTDVATELARLARSGFLLQGLGQESSSFLLNDLEESEVASLSHLGDVSKPFDFNRIFRMLITCQKDLDGGDLDRFILENYFLEWCLDPGLPDLDQLTQLISGAEPGRVSITNQAPKTSPRNTNPGQSPKKTSLVRQFRELTAQDQKPEPRQSPAPTPATSSTPATSTVSAEPGNTEPTSPASKSPEQIQGQETAPATAQTATKASRFPQTWADLVRFWKKLSILEAGVLEEVVPVTYSPEGILLRAQKNSFAASELSKPEFGQKIRDSLKTHFDFDGQFGHVLIEDAGTGADQHEMKGSVLEEKKREKSEKEAKILSDAQNHPLTQSLAQTFQASEIKSQLRSDLQQPSR